MLSFRRTYDSISNNWDKTQSKLAEENENILNYLTKDEHQREFSYEDQSFIIASIFLVIVIFSILLILL